MLDKFKSRKFWLAVVGQVTGLLVLFFPEHATAIEAAVTNAAALLLMALTAAGYIRAEADVDRQIVQTSERMQEAKLLHEQWTRGHQGAKSGPIKPLTLTAGLLLAVVVAGGGGCAATPEARWYEQRAALNSANRVFLANRHQLSDEQVIQVGYLLQAARVAIDEAKAYLPEGGPKFDGYLRIVAAVLDKVIEQQQEMTSERSHDSRSDRNGPGDPRLRHYPAPARPAGGAADRGPEAADPRRGEADRRPGRSGGQGRPGQARPPDPAAGPPGRLIYAARAA